MAATDDVLRADGVEGDQPTSALTPRRRKLARIEAAAAPFVALVLFYAGTQFGIDALASRGWTPFLGAAVCYGLMVAVFRWSSVTEHRLRQHQPAAKSWAAKHSRHATATRRAAAASKVAAPATRRRRQRKYSPVTASITMLVLVAGTIGFTVGTVITHSMAARSDYVQAHGTRVAATVDSVNNDNVCSSNAGCQQSADIDVTLTRPVAGRQTSDVHYPNASNLNPGQQIAVLVDPRQPDYAEIPGVKDTTAILWIVLLVLALLSAVGTVGAAKAILRLRAHQREHRAQSAAA